MNARKLEGVIPALLVPLTDDGRPDYGMLRKQVRYLLDAGATGIFVNGSTGESAFATTAEKVDILRAVWDENAGRAVLCAACIRPSTEEVLAELEVIGREQPDYVVAVTPYYFGVGQGVIAAHYRAIADASPAPVLMYDIPSCTHNKIALATALQVAEHPNIAGIKDSSGNFIGFSRAMMRGAKPGFVWIQGDDYLDGASFLMGASGIVTGTGNVWLAPYVEMWKAMTAGNRDEVLACQKRIDALQEIFQVVDGRVIPGIKAATALLGRSTPWMRQRSMTIADAEMAKIRAVLEDLALL